MATEKASQRFQPNSEGDKAVIPVIRFLLITLVVPVVALAYGHDGSQPRSLPGEGLAPIQEAARELAREVEYLQEDIVAELSGQKERTLYRQSDDVLGDIDEFQKALKPGAMHKQLSMAFDGLDQKLQKLLKTVQALGSEQRLLQRSAARVGAADEELHYAICQHDSGARKSQLLERQTRALVTAAGQLDKTAEYALGTVQGRGVLVGDLHKLAEATEHFQRTVAGGAGLEQLRKDFAAVNRAWDQAVHELDDLKPRKSVYLLRSAGRVNRLHERLFRLLGLEGEPPRLIIRT